MRALILAATLVSTSLAVPARAQEGLSAEQSASLDRQLVGAVLDRLHASAARADGPTYFAQFAPDAVYVGTDAAEVWTLAQFRAFAEPYFRRGQGWTYRPRRRSIVIAPGGQVAWFEEVLDSESYGTSRGSGVLVKRGGDWKIVQYVLSFPIPNAIAHDLTDRIRAAEAAPN